MRSIRVVRSGIPFARQVSFCFVSKRRMSSAFNSVWKNGFFTLLAVLTIVSFVRDTSQISNRLKRFAELDQRIGQAPVAGIEVRAFLDRTGQESTPEWTIRDESDAELPAGGQHTVRFHVARSKRVFTLQGGHRKYLRGP